MITQGTETFKSIKEVKKCVGLAFLASERA